MSFWKCQNWGKEKCLTIQKSKGGAWLYLKCKYNKLEYSRFIFLFFSNDPDWGIIKVSSENTILVKYQNSYSIGIRYFNIRCYDFESYAIKSFIYKQYFDNFSYIVLPKINDHLNWDYFIFSKRLVVFTLQ